MLVLSYRQRAIPENVSNYYIKMQMKLTTVILLFLFPTIGLFAQNDKIIESLTISHWGDSLIPQNYELIVESHKVFFINPVINYRDIKNGKHKYNIQFKRKNRKELFSLLNRLDFSNLKENKNLIKLDLSNLIEIMNFKRAGNFYGFQIRYRNKDFESYALPEESIPSDFKELYTKIIQSK
jgi:hypothetical protein